MNCSFCDKYLHQYNVGEICKCKKKRCWMCVCKKCEPELYNRKCYFCNSPFENNTFKYYRQKYWCCPKCFYGSKLKFF